MLLALLWLLLPNTAVIHAQPDAAQAQETEEETVWLTVRLRYDDGTAVAGEPVRLATFPEADAALGCTTDAAGACRWPVTPGIYQLLLERPLDDLSAAAVAEGGLRGLGVTVGESDVTTHLTLPDDGHVYFDAAPEAAVPAPIMPTYEEVHLHGHADHVLPESAPTETATLSTTVTAETAVSQTETGSSSSFPTLLLAAVLAGVVGGWLLYRRTSPAHRETAVAAPHERTAHTAHTGLPDDEERR